MANKKISEAKIVDEVEITTLNDEEVSEEVVQAVAQAIVEEAEETDKTVNAVINEIVEEAKENAGKYTGDLRGFETLEEAINYPNTPEFEKLDIGCKTEYTNWLKNIL